MNKLDPIPAIRRIDTDRDDVFAVEISGFVTGGDIENLYGLLEGAYVLHERLDLIVRIKNYEGIERDGISTSTTDEGRRHAIDHISRCAAIGDPDWTGHVQGFFEPKIPVELRHFSLDDEAEAWAWIGATERPENI